MASECVTRILCALGSAGVAAVQGYLDTGIALLEAQLLPLRAQLLALDAKIAPIRARTSAVLGVVDGTLSAVNGGIALVSPSALRSCLPLAKLELNVDLAIPELQALAQGLEDQLRRLLAVREQVENIIASIEAEIAALRDIRIALDLCASSSTATV